MASIAIIPPARTVVLCLGIGLWVASLVSCKKTVVETTPIVTVQTAVAEKTDLVQAVETDSILYPIDQAAITPKVAAPVKRFYVNRGDRVRKGQLLAALENGDLSAAVLENRGELESAQAAFSNATRATLPEEWRKAELDVTATKQMLDAEQRLYSSREELFKQGALPRKELDQAGVVLTQARNQYVIAHQHLNLLQAVGKRDQLKSATAQLTTARGKYLGASAQLNYTEIRSPIDGLVAERPLYAGETAPAGTPLIVVVDSSKVTARAHLSQEQAALLKIGDLAEITVPGVDEVTEGKVTMVSPATDPNSTTVEVWVEAANPGGRLRPGVSAHLSIIAAKFTGAIAVPAESIVSSDGKATVMVVGRDNIVHRTEVKTGVRSGKKIQISEGLRPGETVVSAGAYGLPDGTKIHLQPAGPDTENDRTPREKED